ncbi:MAG: hypothetical protein ACJASX_002104 [Limisphaerales bacterium]|jgi:hypothetical protein
MSAQASTSKPLLRSALNRLVRGSFFPLDKMEQCDACHRLFSLRKVQLVGKNIYCEKCCDSEDSIPSMTSIAAETRPWHSV